MTGISSHVFKRLVIVIFQSGSLTLVGPPQGSVNTIELVSSREMAYYMTVYDWDLFSCVQEVSYCNLSIRLFNSSRMDHHKGQ